MADEQDHAGPVKRALTILRLLATSGRRGMALTDVARATRLPNSTIHRLLNQLVEERLVMQIEGSRFYAIGPLAYELGLAAAQQFDIRSLMRPAMERLSLQAQETVYLILRSGDEAVCIDLVEGPTPVRVMTLQVGSRRPLGLGAGGLAILAAMAKDDQERVVERVGPKIQEQWGFSTPLLMASLASTRSIGFAVIRNRVNPGVTAIGSAIHDSLDHVFGAVTIAASSSRMNEARVRDMQLLLRRAGQDMRKVMRGNQWARYVD
jgi:DNA-binding IclR family transcriptional regulator